MISVVILNWNGKKVTADCLDSVKGQTFKNYEVILVDNASDDGSCGYLKKKFPFVKLIRNEENLGYAGGNNVGVKSARGKYILILNNDVILDRSFLSELWKNRNKADILGVKNYYFNKKNVIWAVGSSVNKFTMRAGLVGNKLKDSENVNKMKIEHAVGSAIFINKKVIDKIGFLNEDFFAYFEETEWQTRAERAGFTISWVPTAKLWHRVAYSTGGGRSPMSAYYLVRNRGYFIKKYAGWKIIAWTYWIIEVLARIFYGLVKNREYSKMSFRGMMDLFKGVVGRVD